MENLSLGFLLMLVGMVTVFAILLIVIYGSRLLISLLNKIVPAEQKTSPSSSSSSNQIPRQVFEEAVFQLTGGKGHLTEITKL